MKSIYTTASPVRESSADAPLIPGAPCANRREEGDSFAFDHLAVAEQVRLALQEEPGLRGVQVHIEAFAGVVQLSGLANTAEQMNQMVVRVAGLPGVTSVRNCLRLAA
ncbi:BON domain-containing protein [Halorhodospira halophila]|uniref:Transport-associated protein n=1 Tax=Halorhodospira halophila (strain DSM 244 / SL1) TaxID=349124 RepID=A1WU00_HALHL|nr:BON domain-containing protein [Halorhodospira halophila]ABM61162.1 transport-associated protein [Halorhodospira halophila SL1]MBK1729645.1 BON domain-containing protein [Halorhodospira halophila]